MRSTFDGDPTVPMTLLEAKATVVTTLETPLTERRSCLVFSITASHLLGGLDLDYLEVKAEAHIIPLGIDEIRRHHQSPVDDAEDHQAGRTRPLDSILSMM